MTRVELEKVLARIEVGDTAAWNELLGSLRVRMLRLLTRRGCDPDLAEDLVQEALASVWRSFRNVRDPDRFWSWATTIALNQLRSARNRTRVAEELPSEIPMATRDPARDLVRKETRSWILDRIEGFGRPELGEAVRLRVLESMEPALAARAMGVSRSRLRKWLYLGLHRLRTTSRIEAQGWARALTVAG